MHEVPALKHLKYVTVISQKKKKKSCKISLIPNSYLLLCWYLNLPVPFKISYVNISELIKGQCSLYCVSRDCGWRSKQVDLTL